MSAREAFRLYAAVIKLLGDVHARHPGEELRCPYMIELRAAAIRYWSEVAAEQSALLAVCDDVSASPEFAEIKARADARGAA